MKAKPKPKAKKDKDAKGVKPKESAKVEPERKEEPAKPEEGAPSSPAAGSGVAAARQMRSKAESAESAEAPDLSANRKPTSEQPEQEPAAETVVDSGAPATEEAPSASTEAKTQQPAKDLSSIPDPWAEISDELALARIKEEEWEVIEVASEPSAPSHLAAKDSELSDMRPSDGQRKQLVSADVSENNIATAEALGGPLWLRYLNISLNPISSLDGLAHLFPRLLVLDLSFVELSEVSGAWTALAALPRLRKLVAEGSGVASFDELEDMPELRMLELNGNALEELSELDTLAAKCPGLLELDLRENDLASEPGYAKKVKKLWPKLAWFDGQSQKKYVAAGAAAVYDAEVMREKDVAAIDGMFKNESCSCLEGNPCLDRATCKDWANREKVAAAARKKKGLRDDAGKML
ncbi:Nisch [Symbiodinium natans]|uniref:Nisch protein n=1 Tax=Symbiodinium natans TaxID=878477 RepID=A0A812V733_9DINO|nr:Nisch [Symbiodinium natans]